MLLNVFQHVCKCYSEPELFTHNLRAEAGMLTLLPHPPITGMIQITTSFYRFCYVEAWYSMFILVMYIYILNLLLSVHKVTCKYRKSVCQKYLGL